MDTVPNEDIVYAAQLALAHFHPETPEQAADMLLFWRRRSELTDADVAEVCERMFPKPVELMECPAWCEVDHSRFQYNEIENLCEHDKELLVVRDEHGAVKLQVLVTATDNLTDRRRDPAGIFVHADEPITPDQAIEMVGAVTGGLRIIATS